MRTQVQTFSPCCPALARILVCAALAPLALGGPGRAAAADATPLIVAIDDSFPPYSFRDADGNLTGYLVDVWKLWQRKTGVPVTLYGTSLTHAKETLLNGQADVLDPIFETTERDQVMDFGPAYAKIPVMIYTDADIGGITSVPALRGFRVGTRAGSACAAALAAQGVTNQQLYPDDETIIRAASLRQVRVFCMDAPPAEYLLYRDHLDQRFKQAFEMYVGEFHRAVRKGDHTTLTLVERGFAGISADEDTSLRDKWLGRNLAKARYMHYVAYGSLVAAAVGILLLLWGITLRRLVQRRTEELESERVYLQSLIRAIPDLVWVKDSNGVYLSCNSSFERLFGKPVDSIVGKTDYDFVTRETADSFRENDKMTMRSDRPLTKLEWVVLTGETEKRLFETVKTAMRDTGGKLIGVLGVARDITAHHHAEENLKRLNRALKMLSRCNHALVHAQDEQALLEEICRLVVEQGGYRMAWVGFCEHDADKNLRGVAGTGPFKRYMEELRPNWRSDSPGVGPAAIHQGKTAINQSYQDPSMAALRDVATRYGFASSIALPLMIRATPIGVLVIHASEPHAFGPEEVKLLEEMSGDLAFGIDTLRSRQEQAATERKLEHLAHHDPLTGLPNRVLLRDRFAQAAASAHRDGAGVAVLFLDLDNFKTVNDSLGHSVGDQLLLKVVERLRACIRASDTISRQGGDEFVILLNEVRDTAVVSIIAQSMMEAFADPFPLEGYLLNTSFSIGISLFPQDGLQFDTLLKAADTALHQAKDSGRNTYRFFVEAMNLNAQEHVRLQGELHSALKHQEFVLHYQPEIDMRSGQIVGAEALLRWQHPQRGLVPPGTFIPLAERSGLIVPIGTWVLHEACRQAQAWRTQGLPLQAVAVNLSALQFKRGNLLETVLHALNESGLPAHHLELELTESILLQDIDAAIRTLYSLRELGVRLAIDDFGTGYSSLSYLKRLAVNKLKIDQSFVRDLVDSPDDAAIVRAVIQLGHNLQLSVIAEGVETQAQWNYLSRFGCDEAQGYLLGKPTPAGEFAALYATRMQTTGQRDGE